MPWEATDAMKERTKFVLEWERRWREAEGGPVNMAELCRIFGVSRQTGYKWVERYRGAGFALAGVGERSRRPHRSPEALPVELGHAWIHHLAPTPARHQQRAEARVRADRACRRGPVGGELGLDPPRAPRRESPRTWSHHSSPAPGREGSVSDVSALSSSDAA
jgi:transposase-like protein